MRRTGMALLAAIVCAVAVACTSAPPPPSLVAPTGAPATTAAIASAVASVASPAVSPSPAVPSAAATPAPSTPPAAAGPVVPGPSLAPCVPPGPRLPLPAGLAPGFPLPPGSVITSVDPIEGGIRIAGYAPIQLRAAVLFFRDDLTAAGYPSDEGDAEQDEAEANFAGANGFHGRWKINGIVGCQDAVTYQITFIPPVGWARRRPLGARDGRRPLYAAARRAA